MKIICVISLSLAFVAAGASIAQTPKAPKVFAVNGDPGTNKVDVLLVSRQKVRDEWLDKNNWSVTISGKGVGPTTGAPTAVNGPNGHNELEFTMVGILPEDAVISITYDDKPVKETAGKTDPEIPLSIKGSFSPGLSSDSQYTLDASGNFAFPFAHQRWAIGGVAAVAADKRKGVDPDSFTVTGLTERVQIHSSKAFPETDYELFVPGGEFSRQDTTRNLISGFVVRQSVRLPERYKPNSVFIPSLWIGLGMEGGENFKNLVTPTSGLGAVARGYGSVDFALTVRPPASWSFLESVTLSSDYRVRIPAYAESFTYTVDKTDYPYLSTKAAHHIKSELDFNLTDDFAISATHEYGYLPPVFRLVDHSLTIGLKYSLKASGHSFSGVTGL